MVKFGFFLKLFLDILIIVFLVIYKMFRFLWVYWYIIIRMNIFYYFFDLVLFSVNDCLFILCI